MSANRVSRLPARPVTPSLFADEEADAGAPAVAPPQPPELLERVAALESSVAALASLVAHVHDLIAAKVVVKEFYTTAEAATLLGKRPYTVREWCRLGRVHAVKTHSGRGEGEEWRIGHDELTRIQNEGLLPLPKH